jgi:hypothetical protein
MTRCRAAWWLRAHAVLLRQARDAAGRAVVPHTLVWECWRCGRALGRTIAPSVEARWRATGDEIPVRRTSGRRENAPLRLIREQSASSRR